MQLPFTLTRTILALSLCYVVASARAQDAPNPPNPPNPPSLPLILSAPPSAGTLRMLVMRPEVQNELHLSLQQKNALAGAFPDGPRTAVRVSAQANGGSQDDIKKQVEDQIAAQFGAMDEKLKSILKPEQIKRLHELELQWRGPVALGDSKVAEEVRLSSEHRAEIARLVSEYNTKRFEILSQSAQVSGDGNRRTFIMRAPESESPLSPRRKQLDALKKDVEDKILAILTAEERSRWKAAQGAPFVFRKDQPSGPPKG